MIPVRYCTGMLQPAKSTILPPWLACQSWSTVLLDDSLMGQPSCALHDVYGEHGGQRPKYIRQAESEDSLDFEFGTVASARHRPRSLPTWSADSGVVGAR